MAIDTEGKDIKRRLCPLLGVQVTQDWLLDLNLVPSENLVLFSVLIVCSLSCIPLNVYFQAYLNNKCFLYILQIGRVKFKWPREVLTLNSCTTGMDVVEIAPWSGCVSVLWLYYIYCIFNPVKYKWIRILNLPFKCIRLLMLLKEIPTNGIISGGFVCLF